MAHGHKHPVPLMKRRSNKKPIFNNVFTDKHSRETSATSAANRSVATVNLDNKITLRQRTLFQTASLLLLFSFLLQPIFAQAEAQAQAEPLEPTELTPQETITDKQPPADETLVEPELELEIEPEPEPEIQLPPQSEPEPEIQLESESATQTMETNTTELPAADALTPATSSTATTTAVLPDPEATVDTTSAPEPVASSTATTTQTAQDNQESEGAGSSNDESDTTDDQAELTVASENVVSVVQTDAEFSFNSNECTQIEDGSFYCQKATAPVVQQNDLFAALDRDGDLEIYLRREGENIQITQNLVDDASPFFDVRSNTVVWHRLLQDRYQIVSYDVASGEEEIITDTRVNNMEPSRSGDATVWQRWVDNNWEIILSQAGEEVQLTDSIEHDIAPNIRGDLVIWNVRASDGTHSLMTYDVSSGVYNEISDPDGVAVSNPRMVVVYDAVYANGDTIMRGFDLITGELIPLQQIPAELPEQLPEPDSTGETRAFIAPAPAKPEQAEEESEPDPITDDFDKEMDLNLATSTPATSTVSENSDDLFELDLRLVPETVGPVDPIIDDLVILPLASGTTSTSTQN